MLNLPTELLRTFIKAVDLGSFTRAGDAVGRTQSAVSLQMRRLEELLGAGEIALLLADQSEQVKCIGVLWLRGENLLVERGGFAQLPGAVMLQREL